MDHGKRQLALALGAALLVCGCGQSTPAPTASSPMAELTPEAVTAEFLEAVRVGDDKKVATLLTSVTRQRTAEQEMVVAPPGSDTASFAVREVVYVDEGAHVASDWTDVDVDGRMHTDRIVWILRKGAEGWRIAGMATKIFDDRPPVVQNFEDPEDMLRKRQWVHEEMARREGGKAAGKSKEAGSQVR
jgi:hypothetical protein